METEMDVETLRKYNREEFEGKFQMACNFIKAKKIGCLKHALRLDPPLIGIQDPMGETLLMKSARYDEEEAVRVLLQHGILVNQASNAKCTALYYAIKEAKSVSIVKILIEHGADVWSFVFNAKLQTPLSLALNLNELNITHVLLEHDETLLAEEMWLPALIKSIIQRNERLLGSLLKMNQFLNHINDLYETDKTPLMHACMIGHQENEFFIQMLLENNASIKKRDKNGHDSFFFAVQQGKLAIVDCFIQKGYRLEGTNLTEKYGSPNPNVIFEVIMKQTYFNDLIKKLIYISLEHAPELLNQTNRQGQTIFHLAAQLQNGSIYSLLLDMPIDKSVRDINGKTASEIAFEVNRSFTSFHDLCQLTKFIKSGDCESIKGSLEHGKTIKLDHIITAVKEIDSDLPDSKRFYFNRDFPVRIEVLFIFFEYEGTTEMCRNTFREVALRFAFALNKFKIIYYAAKKYSSTFISKFINNETSRSMISFEMFEFMKREKIYTAPMPESKISIDPHEMLQDEGIFYLQSFSKFLYLFTTWKFKEEHYEALNDFLATAINFRREDIATVILQQGPKPKLDENHERWIVSHFSKEFNNLYDESRGCGGMLSLKELARVAMREDLYVLHYYWLNEIAQPILKYTSKFYDVNFKDQTKRSALMYAHEERNPRAMPYIEEEGCITKDQFVEDVFEYLCSYRPYVKYRYKFFYTWEFSNPLLVLIKRKDYCEIKRLLECASVDVNSFYEEKFTALHYAIIVYDMEIIKMLVKHGAKDAMIKCKPYYNCRSLARRVCPEVVEDFLKKYHFTGDNVYDNSEYNISYVH